MAREEKLDDLIRKTSNMSAMATNIRKTATAVKNKTWWELWKLRILIIVAVAVVETQEIPIDSFLFEFLWLCL